MEGYLGETKISTKDALNKDYGIFDWVTYWINQYGYIEGDHHKKWLIDQCLRISMGTPVEAYLARWENGHEETRFRLGEPSSKYLKWVQNNHEWDSGIAP